MSARRVNLLQGGSNVGAGHGLLVEQSESETGHLGADGKEVVLVLQDDDEVGAIHHDIDEEEAILGRVGEIKADHPEENVTGREVSPRVVVVSVSMLATIDVADIQERMKMTEEDEGEAIAHENMLEIATGRNDGPYRIEAEVQAHDDIEMKNAVRYPDENTEETTAEVRVHVAAITKSANQVAVTDQTWSIVEDIVADATVKESKVNVMKIFVIKMQA